MYRKFQNVFIVLCLCLPDVAVADLDKKLHLSLVMDNSGSMAGNDPTNLAPLTAHLITSIVDERHHMSLRLMAQRVKEKDKIRLNFSRRDNIRTQLENWCPRDGVQYARMFLDSFKSIRDTLLKHQGERTERIVISLTDGEYEPEEWTQKIFPRMHSFSQRTNSAVSIFHIGDVNRNIGKLIGERNVGYVSLGNLGRGKGCKSLGGERVERFFLKIFRGFLGSNALAVRNPNRVEFHPYATKAHLVAVGVRRDPQLKLRSAAKQGNARDVIAYTQNRCKRTKGCSSGYKLINISNVGQGPWKFDASRFDALFKVQEIGIDIKSSLTENINVGDKPEIEISLISTRTGKRIRNLGFLNKVQLTLKKSLNESPFLRLRTNSKGVFKGTISDNGRSIFTQAGDVSLYISLKDEPLNLAKKITRVVMPLAPDFKLSVEPENPSVGDVDIRAELYAKGLGNLPLPKSIGLNIYDSSGDKIETISMTRAKLGKYSGSYRFRDPGRYTLESVMSYGGEDVSTKLSVEIEGVVAIEIAPIEFAAMNNGEERVEELYISTDGSSGKHELQFDVQGLWGGEVQIKDEETGRYVSLDGYKIPFEGSEEIQRAIRFRHYSCSSTPEDFKIVGSTGADELYSVDVALAVTKPSWLRCQLPNIIAFILLLIAAYVVRGFIVPVRFNREHGILVHPGLPFFEKPFPPSRIKGRIGWYQDARVYLNSLGQQVGSRRQATVVLIASKAGIVIEALDAQCSQQDPVYSGGWRPLGYVYSVDDNQPSAISAKNSVKELVEFDSIYKYGRDSFFLKVTVI